MSERASIDPRTPPAVLWLTGLSGSGKTTLGDWLTARIAASDRRVEHLDGDALRNVFPGTGFSPAERDAHVRRVGYLSSRLEYHGVFVVASLISPYRASRDFVRGLCRRFFEVHVSTPLEVCEQRDVKGLYARARTGDVGQFTGISDPYEPPVSPELVVDTSVVTVEEAGKRLVALLNDQDRRT